MVQFLEETTNDQKSKVLVRLGMTTNNLNNDISAIKSWIKTQPHLPETPSDNTIRGFLIMSKFSIEKAKTKIDAFYTIWCKLPGLLHLETINPTSPIQMDYADINYFIPLPKQIDEFCRVSILKFLGRDAEANPILTFVWTLNVFLVRVQEDVSGRDVFILDLSGCTFKHFTKITPTMIKMAVQVYKKIYTTKLTAALHFINCPPATDYLMKIVKSAISAKILNRIFVHKTLDTLYESVPKSILPRDYGGGEKSLKELNDILKSKMMEYKEYFDRLDSFKVNEHLRPEKLPNDDFFGFYGNFKQLDFD